MSQYQNVQYRYLLDGGKFQLDVSSRIDATSIEQPI